MDSDAGWLQGPHALNQDTGGWPTCDGCNVPGTALGTGHTAVPETDSSPSLPHGVCRGHSIAREVLGTQRPGITLTIPGCRHQAPTHRPRTPPLPAVFQAKFGWGG